MAEFGENLKKAREKSGMTQQSLADKIYVTRQAVSRWENGSRYPDLMTTKRLAQLLHTTLDELVMDDDMAALPERNPVTEYPISKRIQTMLMTCGLIPYLICSVWYTLELLTEGTAGLHDTSMLMQVVLTIIGSYLLTGLFGFGLYMSVRDNITPAIAGGIGGVFFGIPVIQSLFDGQIRLSLVTNAAYLACMGIMLVYFLTKKLKSPLPVYAVSLLRLLLRVSWSVYSMVHMAASPLPAYAVASASDVSATDLGGVVVEASVPVFGYYSIRSIMTLFAEAALLLLLCFMAHDLHVKRKVSAAQPDGSNDAA